MTKQLASLLPESFSSMTMEEKLAFIAQVRQSRSSPKATSKVVQRAKKEKKKKLDGIAEQLASLPKEELLKLLGG